MSYTKHTWVTGETITAEKLNNIEDGIDGIDGGKQNAPATAGTAGQVLSLDNQLNPVWADQTITDYVASIGALGTVTLGTTWTGSDPYTSTVTVTGCTVTEKTLVNILPDPAVVEQMQDDGIAEIYITNNGGALTATAVGGVPTQAITLNVLCTESDFAADIDELSRQLSDFYIDNTISFSQNTLYKENTCIYPDGTEHSIQGYNTYKIPVKHGDGVFLKQSQSDPWFFGTITVPYQAGVIDSNNNYTAISNTSEIYKSSPTNREAYYLLSGDYVEMAFCIKAGTESTVKIWNGKTYANEISAPNVLNTDAFPSKIDKLNPIITQSFVNNELGITDLPRPYYVKTIYVSAGDSVSLSAKAGTLRFYGVYVNVKEKTADNITTSQYTFAADGVAFIFAHETEDINVYISSNNKVPVDFSQITNYPGGNWTDLSGVAFGTSLTERAKDYVGYLTYLPSLSGIAFDNQGRSSGEIMGVILTQIKAYTLYSSKSVCLLEGFVNDWYQGNELGTWKDTSETTVCGCVRSAINYIYQQNSSITLFLILDHYGRDNGGVNCASDAVNRNGLTQFEFYNEISKVAASLGVPVIKEYEYSQISENTPQYLADNIHLTALGSQQSANYIWATMNNRSPNTI